MLILISTILVASLVGSLHCAGMCGAFLAIATGTVDASPKQRALTQMAYHLGRLATYVTLGSAAGAVGALVDLTGRLAGIQAAATMVAGAVMVTFGAISLMRIYGVRMAGLRLPAFWQRMVAGAHQRSMRYEPMTRAALIGLSTTLLPCGWLYAFVVTAAGTGHPATGALAMAAFWVGTLPVMVGLGIGVQALLGRFGSRVPAITCLLLIAVGGYTLVGRGHLSPAAMANSAAGGETHSCCEVGAE